MKAQVLTALGAWMALTACGGRPEGGQVNGAIDGMVVVSGPTVGVVVSAYTYDLVTGDHGELVATSAATQEDGRFHLDLGPHHGPLMLSARGSAASYVEPASGVSVAWDQATELRAVWVDRTPADDLTFDFARKTQAASFVISPWTDLAVTYGEARARGGQSSTLEEGLRRAHLVFRDHLRYDYWSVEPVLLTGAPVGGWNEAVQAGVELAGLSSLVRRAADKSQLSASGLTTLQLVALLERDLKDAGARLDGNSQGDPLTLGSCDSLCQLSGKTLRGDLAESVAVFLGSMANTSGIAVSDALTLLDHVACNDAEIFPALAGPCTWDTEPPTITVEGLQEGAILTGNQLDATITLKDSIGMGDYTLAFTRAGQPVTGFYTVAETSPDAQTRVLTLALDSTAVTDGPLRLEVSAKDQAGNAATPASLGLFADNSPLGHVAGTVALGGRVAGARVRLFEYDGEVRGALLGEATTDAGGLYVIEVAATAQTTLLVEIDNPPGGAASYVEASSGATIALSTDETVSSVITGWFDGDERGDGMVTPWTHLATALAHGLWITRYHSVAARYADAVDDAFRVLEGHFLDGGPVINLRTVQPADLTSTEGTSTLNSQVRYGLVTAALGVLADDQAADSSATPASMNTLSLTRRLAQDLGEDAARSETGEPLFDGKTAGGALKHGQVTLTSYTTRNDLAGAAVKFLETNPRNATSFVEADVAPLMDAMAQDARTRLYPASQPPVPYDTVPPTLAFVAPTPGVAQVLRGNVSLKVEASDNRALDQVAWMSPAGIAGVALDTTGGIEGPWRLIGSFNTDSFPEGPLAITAKAVDQGGRTTTASRTVILDRTAPVVAITEARHTGNLVLTPGGWTGASSITVRGTARDAHLATVTLSASSGTQTLTVGGGGSWTAAVALVGGANAVTVKAVDAAGNQAATTVTYNRDATAPGVTVVPAQVGNDTLTTATLSPATGRPTSVTYSGAQMTTLGSGATITRYASRLEAGSPDLPRWNFSVSDNHTLAARLTFAVQVVSPDGDDVLGGFRPIVFDDQATFNRTLVISRQLSPIFTAQSGRYTLNWRATDEFGNQSTGSVTWTVALKAPPIRHRLDAYCPPAHPNCAASYSLSGPVNDAYKVMAAGGLPNSEVWAAGAVIDNPSEVPVRVRLSGSGTATYKRNLKIDYPTVDANPTMVTDGCNPGAMGVPARLAVPPYACYSIPNTAVQVGTTQTTTAFFKGVRVFNGSISLPIAPCAGCASNEFDLPPHAEAIVMGAAYPYSFLYDSATAVDLGTLHVTGKAIVDWLRCTQTDIRSGSLSCTHQVVARTISYLTHVEVTPSVQMSVTTAPAGYSSFSTPTGDGQFSGLAYRAFTWTSSETGF